MLSSSWVQRKTGERRDRSEEKSVISYREKTCEYPMVMLIALEFGPELFHDL